MNQPDLFITEDVRAAIDGLPDSYQLKPSDRPCEWVVTARGSLLRSGCIGRAYWWRVNHLLLSLCRCHAGRLAMRSNVSVLPVRPDSSEEGNSEERKR